eukprot:gene9466-12142_t
MDFETEGRELEAVLRGAKVKSMEWFGRGELVGVCPSRELNAVGSPKKGEFPDEGLTGAVVALADVSLDKQASGSVASGAIGELGNAEDAKKESSLTVCEEVPKAPVDVTVDGLIQDKQQVLDSVTCSHNLEDTCLGIEVSECADEFSCAYTNDVVGECLSGGAAAPCDWTVCLRTVSCKSECVDEDDVDASIRVNFIGEAIMPGVTAGEDQYDDFGDEVIIEEWVFFDEGEEENSSD